MFTARFCGGRVQGGSEYDSYHTVLPLSLVNGRSTRSMSWKRHWSLSPEGLVERGGGEWLVKGDTGRDGARISGGCLPKRREAGTHCGWSPIGLGGGGSASWSAGDGSGGRGGHVVAGCGGYVGRANERRLGKCGVGRVGAGVVGTWLVVDKGLGVIAVGLSLRSGARTGVVVWGVDALSCGEGSGCIPELTRRGTCDGWIIEPVPSTGVQAGGVAWVACHSSVKRIWGAGACIALAPDSFCGFTKQWGALA